jgi:pimeloyl-ACP methyl ester carboxylesterase
MGVGLHLLAAAAVVLSGTSSTAGAPPAGPTHVLSWRACSQGSAYLCADLTVPLNYADPSAGTIKLALAELPATGKHVVGDLVMNPGGPGASGIQFLEQANFPAPLQASFNLVSFDPRGIGASDPVTCVGSAGIRSMVALDPDPTTPVEIGSVVRATKAFDHACAARTSAGLLHNVTTMDTARDMDRIRAALGQAKLDYFGLSYGTYLGELYAEMFPSHVQAMVLDGAVDPALSDNAVAAQQAAGFQSDLEDFFAWCPTDQSCTQELPGGARSSYRRLMRSIQEGHPLFANLQPQFGGKQRVTFGVAETAVLGSLYSTQTWGDLAQAIAQGLAGDGSLLVALAYGYEGLQADGHFDNSMAANAAINCTDRSYPTSVGTYEQLAAQLQKAYPDFGALSAWSNIECAYWPVHSTAGPAPARTSHTPILVIGSTGDPATPYAWAKAVTRELGDARLLTRRGPGHTGYFYSTCVQRWANRYLETLQLPPKGTICPSSS